MDYMNVILGSRPLSVNLTQKQLASVFHGITSPPLFLP